MHTLTAFRTWKQAHAGTMRVHRHMQRQQQFNKIYQTKNDKSRALDALEHACNDAVKHHEAHCLTGKCITPWSHNVHKRGDGNARVKYRHFHLHSLHFVHLFTTKKHTCAISCFGAIYMELMIRQRRIRISWCKGVFLDDKTQCQG